MFNPRSLENLRRFSTENQPPRNGRPVGSVSIVTALKKILARVDPKSKKMLVELLATDVLEHARKGNAAIFKEIIGRVDGPIPDRTEKTGKELRPIVFHVIEEEEKLPRDGEIPADENVPKGKESPENSGGQGKSVRLRRRKIN